MNLARHQFLRFLRTIDMKSAVAVVLLVAVAAAHPTLQEVSPVKDTSFWKGTTMDSVVEGLKVECTDKNDGIACIKFKVLDLIDQALRKDSFQVSDTVSVVKNTEESTKTEEETTSGRGFVDSLENYVQSHDMLVRLPRMLGGSTLAISPRNIDNNEITLSLRSSPDSDDAQVEGKSRKRRKSKLKKILVPILVFFLLKAMTLIPLAIGVLGLKAWNALQLSFFSFLISISLAMFQLFKKIAADSTPAAAVHAAPWQEYSNYAAARNLLVQQQAAQDQEMDGQQLAYSGYNSQ